MFRWILALIGLLVTVLVTIAFGLIAFAVILDGDNNFAERSFPVMIRGMVLAGLLWTPWVGTKLINPFISFRDHMDVTFRERTFWGITIFVITIIATLAAAITGAYGWFLVAVIAQFLWGIRSGVRG